MPDTKKFDVTIPFIAWATVTVEVDASDADQQGEDPEVLAIEKAYECAGVYRDASGGLSAAYGVRLRHDDEMNEPRGSSVDVIEVTG